MLLGFAFIGVGSCGFFVQRVLRQSFVFVTSSRFFVYVQALANNMFAESLQVPENAEVPENEAFRHRPLSH